MSNTISNLDPDNAPRTVAGLAQFSGYQLQKLAEKIGMIATPESEAVIMRAGRQERAGLVAEGLVAWDKAHGRAVAAPIAIASPVAHPATVTPANGAPPAPGAVIKQPVAPGGSPAPAVAGRTRRTPATTPDAAAPPPAGTAPTAPAAPTAPTVDLQPVLATFETLKANVQCLSKTVLDLQQQNEQFRTKLDAVIFMAAQIGEHVMQVPAQDFIDDAVKFAAHQGKA